VTIYKPDKRWDKQMLFHKLIDVMNNHLQDQFPELSVPDSGIKSITVFAFDRWKDW